ncbi:hypothetical protein [Novipirellula artificiosorum]|uniref:Uncharacterized protein n=1 Tax=Novipirellula artificiosorum TaxID=2528016 RepID=A0A5C6DWZ0_9BACT|nr:hypothetical protein [Novipirellula artificiosorum]TWU40905.1 hypothetical protein Poly41_17400 [Novipirellula artificiosorum]
MPFFLADEGQSEPSFAFRGGHSSNERSGPVMLGRTHLRTCFLVAVVGLIAGQAGCVALNIPSERIADPTDRGGPLGHWRRGGGPHHVSPPGLLSSVQGGETEMLVHDDSYSGEFLRPSSSDTPWGCDTFGGGALTVDPFDASVDEQGTAKPPEVPWPRFHPVPTRPVFGG